MQELRVAGIKITPSYKGNGFIKSLGKSRVPFIILGKLEGTECDYIYSMQRGKLYGAPGATASYLTVYYNKDLFAQAGVNVPAKYSEFINAFNTLKSMNIVPIAMVGQEWICWYFAHLDIGRAMVPDYFDDFKTGKASSFN